MKLGPGVFGEAREPRKELLGQEIWRLGQFGALVFWKSCKGLGLGTRAFGEARELGASSLGFPDAVAEGGCWGEFHVQVLEPEGGSLEVKSRGV